MEILSLGHACYLLEMETSQGGEPLRILADPWLSDYLVGDLLGRFPRVRVEPDSLPRLDAVYISHSHTDHLDPYALVSLWPHLQPRPKLLLPQSLRYLEDLFCRYLDNPEIVFLADREPISLAGATVMGFFNPEIRPTNEDDVMVLSVRTSREAFLCESDALLPFYDPEARALLSKLLGGEGLETSCLLSIKNEGGATMAMLGCDPGERPARLSRELETSYDEIYEIYSELAEAEDDLWSDPCLVRLIGGQGICYPQALETEWNRLLFPIRLADRVNMERDVAGQNELAHSIEEFVPGQMHSVVGGVLAGRASCAYLDVLDSERERHFDPQLALVDGFPCAPLAGGARDLTEQSRRIGEVLEQRFLPHLIGSRAPPIEHLLAGTRGEYRIRVCFGDTSARHGERDWVLRFGAFRFVEESVEGEADEHYWANDLEDFLDGRCDEFSTFCRKPLGGREQRLWRTLGLPYLNNDLIERKIALHFARAAAGEDLENWVLSFHRTPLSQ